MCIIPSLSVVEAKAIIARADLRIFHGTAKSGRTIKRRTALIQPNTKSCSKCGFAYSAKNCPVCSVRKAKKFDLQNSDVELNGIRPLKEKDIIIAVTIVIVIAIIIYVVL